MKFLSHNIIRQPPLYTKTKQNFTQWSLAALEESFFDEFSNGDADLCIAAGILKNKNIMWNIIWDWIQRIYKPFAKRTMNCEVPERVTLTHFGCSMTKVPDQYKVTIIAFCAT